MTGLQQFLFVRVISGCIREMYAKMYAIGLAAYSIPEIMRSYSSPCGAWFSPRASWMSSGFFSDAGVVIVEGVIGGG